jgi:hypothetical protein
MQKFNFHCGPLSSNIRGPVFYLQITETYQEGHNIHTQLGFCSYFFCVACNLAIRNIFLSSNDTEDIYFFQALYQLYQCSFLCLKLVLCKAKENRHQEIQYVTFSDQFLNAYYFLFYCFNEQTDC